MKRTAAELVEFRDLVAAWLASMGGSVTDRGYDFVAKAAELVVDTPSGPRIEIVMRVLP